MATIVPLQDLTQTTLDGSGVFDTLMRSMKAHLEAEYQKGRIKGTEYSTVYLGSLTAVLDASLNFLLQREKVALEAELMAQQILVAQAEVEKARAQVQIAGVELLKVGIEKDILLLSKDKIPAEIAHLEAQTEVARQQQINLASEDLHTKAKTTLTTNQATNAVTEGLVLAAQKCKLDAEFDLTKESTLKAGQETALLAQKVVSEKAQVSALGVDGDSVIGRQKRLYQAQTDGFQRDAEQKAAKVMADFWNVQRTTDEGIAPSEAAANTDVHIGRAINKLLQGVGA